MGPEADFVTSCDVRSMHLEAGQFCVCRVSQHIVLLTETLRLLPVPHVRAGEVLYSPGNEVDMKSTVKRNMTEFTVQGEREGTLM